MALASKSDKIASIQAIPGRFISDAERHLYIQRARAGENVHAFPSPNLDEAGLWRVWDTETSILLPPLATAWRVLSMLHGDGPSWRVICERGPGSLHRRDVALFVHQNPAIDANVDGYMDRAERVIRALISYCSAMGVDPANYEGTHHG